MVYLTNDLKIYILHCHRDIIKIYAEKLQKFNIILNNLPWSEHRVDVNIIILCRIPDRTYVIGSNNNRYIISFGKKDL